MEEVTGSSPVSSTSLRSERSVSEGCRAEAPSEGGLVLLRGEATARQAGKTNSGGSHDTEGWRQGTGFRTHHKGRGRPEEDQAQRQRRQEEHGAVVFPHGLYRRVHEGNVRSQRRAESVLVAQRRRTWHQRRQPVRAGRLGREGKNRRIAARRLRA